MDLGTSHTANLLRRVFGVLLNGISVSNSLSRQHVMNKTLLWSVVYLYSAIVAVMMAGASASSSGSGSHDTMLSSLQAAGGNKYPIVFVHGIGGWGRDELLGFKYWGGLQGDFVARLQAQGYQVYTAAVGPISSNWDRACELYAQIKGGQVQYGANHATKHGHLATGRTYPGLYPQWGTVVDGQVQKIHLIGHSMGGQTIRVLAHLLAYGTDGAPTEEDPESSPLFAGGKFDWIHSITTISTPNQGSLLGEIRTENGQAALFKSLFTNIFYVLNMVGDSSKVMYDLKMDQWGFAPKRPDETVRAYMERIQTSKLFEPGFTDLCPEDAGVAGATALNDWVKTVPTIYYYGFASFDTHDATNWDNQKVQRPNFLTMLIILQQNARLLGGRYGPDHGFADQWQQNDGVVNTVSMVGDGHAQVVDFHGVSRPGRWHRMPVLEKMDHYAMIGMTIHTRVFKLYEAHAKFLQDLPVTAPLPPQRQQTLRQSQHQQQQHQEAMEMEHVASPGIWEKLSQVLTAISNVRVSVQTLTAQCKSDSSGSNPTATTTVTNVVQQICSLQLSQENIQNHHDDVQDSHHDDDFQAHKSDV